MAPSGTASRAAVDPRVVRTRKDVLRAATDLLVDTGWESVTHQQVARVAGYSKATLYTHWPARTDLLVDAFASLGEVPHHTPTGNLRRDLVDELLTFRTAMVEHRLDRALAVLVDLTASVPELVEVRNRLATEGERVVRRLLEPSLRGVRLEAATCMLCGAVVHAALFHGRTPDEDFIEAAVDLALRAVDPAQDTPDKR